MNTSYSNVRERYLLDLWQQYLDSDRLHQLDRFLAQAMRQIRSAGKKDRLWYGDNLFAMMRFAWLAHLLEAAHKAGVDTPEALPEFLRQHPPLASPRDALSRLRKLDSQRLWFWVSARTGLREPPALLGMLESLAESGDHLHCALVWNGLEPRWEHDILDRGSRDGWSAGQLGRFVRQHASRPPVYLRTPAKHHDTVVEDLQANGLQVETVDGALSIRGNKGLYELDTYKAGLFEIQDLASQGIGQRVEARSGEIGWDACAGGGGKTLQLAAMMQGRGAVYASDIRTHKLEEIRRRAKRAELHNIRTIPWAGDPLDRHPADVTKRGGFDWVLVDAPCTSSGTWRRNPDARWRCDTQSLDDIVALQSRLLASAAPSVRPGGRLVYSTCSFLPAENENVVAAFLAAHPDFTLDAQGLHGSPRQDADTMFSARLIRAPAP